MHDTTHHHHHGILAGIFLALGIAALGFLMQADLAKALHGGGQGLVFGGFILIAIVLVILRLRAK